MQSEEERNVYLLQTSLDRVCKASRELIELWEQDCDLDTAIAKLRKALNSK